MNADQLLPLIRALFSRHPDMHNLAAWEMQSALFVLGYTHGLAPEGEIAAAIEVARADRLADLDQLLVERFGATVVRRGLALELSRRQGASSRAKSPFGPTLTVYSQDSETPSRTGRNGQGQTDVCRETKGA